MVRVTLVNPAYGLWNAVFGKSKQEETLIRLGLAYISSALKLHGHQVNLIDLRMLKGYEYYDALVRRQNPDFLSVTMHTGEFDIAIECCKRAKKINPKVITVVGGIHPTQNPQECFIPGVVDYVFRGEGEVTFPKFVEDPEKYPSILWGETPDLNKIPYPDRWLWPDYDERICYDMMPPSVRFGVPMVDLITKRGCPWQCRFCCGPGEQQLFTKVDQGGRRIPSIRSRSVENVIGELKLLYKLYGFKTIYFHDDQFILDPKWVRMFINAMHEHGFVDKGVKWIASCRADVISRFEDLIMEMRDAGFAMALIGFESFSQRILDWIGKGTTVEQNFRAAQICKKLGIKIWANYMLGIPSPYGWDPKDDITTVDALKTIRPEHYSPSYFAPIPGSKLYDWCKENNLIIADIPSNLGHRGTLSKHVKVKGVDYNFLDNIVVYDYHNTILRYPTSFMNWFGISNTRIVLTYYKLVQEYNRLKSRMQKMILPVKAKKQKNKPNISELLPPTEKTLRESLDNLR